MLYKALCGLFVDAFGVVFCNGEKSDKVVSSEQSAG